MRIIFLFLSFCFSGTVVGQLIINETYTPNQLVQDVLVDPTVTPFNITFNGQASAPIQQSASFFSTGNTQTNLGLTSGVILATGRTTAALGPNNAEGFTVELNDPYTVDPDLQYIVGSLDLGSITILEFDFVATGAVLNFDFVFASEEYPEYTNSDYNDVFGFFLSGPGITGPYTNNAKNIALLPNGAEIAINNVNNGSANTGPCQNCQFYIANGTGTTPDSNPNIQYDGFTTVMRAMSGLECGETYHIKLAIANVGDNSYDSAVFIKNFAIQPLELVDEFGFSENTNVCLGQDVSIFADFPVEDNIFVWTRNGVIMPQESGPSITVGVEGLYGVTITTESGCQLAYDEILIGYGPEMAINDPPDINLCALLASDYVFPSIDQTATILSTVASPADYQVTYYNSSFEDADAASTNGIIPQQDLTNYTVQSTVTIWVRVKETALASSKCYKVVSFDLNPYGIQTGEIAYTGSPYCLEVDTPQPVYSTASPNGIFSATPNGLQLDSVTGAITPNASIPGDYDVIYTVPATGSCPEYATPPTTVTINTAGPSAPQVISPVYYCLDDPASPLSADGTNLAWYVSATGNFSTPTAPVVNTSTPGTTTYYVSQKSGNCESPRAVIEVVVFPKMEFVLPQDLFICSNAIIPEMLDSGLDAGQYSFEWFALDTSSSIPIAGANGSMLPLTDPGNYGLIVTNLTSGCESEMATAVVGSMEPPATMEITTDIYFSGGSSISVSVLPQGQYEYQLDDFASQSSPDFVNVTSGAHTVTVRDVNGCGSLEQEVILVNYPKFFTPNGDGYNDTWNINDISWQFASKIKIYDRYGKLIIALTPFESGWDGTFNQQPLPSTDYWFEVQYDEFDLSKTFRSHFSLKR